MFHQRYSTNTHPSWALAQPFRLIAHNGEINTLRGNREAMRGRSARLGGGALGRRLGALARAGRPLLDPAGSDSTSLDESLELLIAAGWRSDAAVMALLPEALDLRDETVPGLAAWQASTLARVEPWDGPAALVFSDGRRVGCLLDRNGLRPAAFEVRRDGLVVCGSEAGMLPVDAREVVRRGRLGPGELLVVDTVAGRVLEDGEAKRAAIAAAPAGPPPRPLEPAALEKRSSEVVTDADEARRRQILFGLDAEQLRMTVKAMATGGREPTWSMGDDTPLAVMARRPRAVSGYLRQAFAQVTNPPIDPERERAVMSLSVPVGPWPRLLDRAGDGAARCVRLANPVLGAAGWDALLSLGDRGPGGTEPWRIVILDATWPIDVGGTEPTALEAALDRLVDQATTRPRARRRPPRGERPRCRLGSGARPEPARRRRDQRGVRRRRPARRLRHRARTPATPSTSTPSRCSSPPARTPSTPGRRSLLRARSPALAATRSSSPSGPRRTCSTRWSTACARCWRGWGSAPLPRTAAGSSSRSSAWPTPSATAASRQRPGRPASRTLERLGAEAVARHATAYGEAPAPAPALVDPGFARFRADGEMHAFAPAIVKATQALAAGHPSGVGPGAALAPGHRG